jgi:hypothetical protein
VANDEDVSAGDNDRSRTRKLSVVQRPSGSCNGVREYVTTYRI